MTNPQTASTGNTQTSTPDIRLIACDMDGTLLNSDYQLPNDFFEVFQALQKKGIYFTAASGRQYHSLLHYFSTIANDMFFIADNGAVVMHQGTELFSATIAREDVTAMVKTARDIQDCHIVLCGKKSAYIEHQHPEALAEIDKYYYRCEYVEDLLNVEDDFIKIALLHFGGSHANIYPTIAEQFSNTHQVVVSAAVWLDIMHQDASKGAAIQKLQHHLRLNREQTMAFGDYLNDLSLLQQATYSYAMANAHDEVKAIAHYQAPSNNDAGVIHVIRSVLFG